MLAGDGAFFMHGMEVHTAVEYAAPVTFVVFNNNAHAMCAMREELFQGGVRTDDLFGRTDIAAGVAAAFPTLDVTRADDAAQLRQALLRSNAERRPGIRRAGLRPGRDPAVPAFPARRRPPLHAPDTRRHPMSARRRPRWLTSPA